MRNRKIRKKEKQKASRILVNRKRIKFNQRKKYEKKHKLKQQFSYTSNSKITPTKLSTERNKKNKEITEKKMV